MRKSERIPELDGLRVIMIFVVSWYHIWQQSWLHPMVGGVSLDFLVRSGYVWVDGTVLLSAFLLSLPYARAGLGEGSLPEPREFYWRRAKRILPSYYFIILATFFGICLPWKLYANAPYMVKDLATHFTFTFPFFQDTYIGTPLGAASWTLAIEVQAYVLFPWVARAAMKRPAAVMIVLALICFGFRAWCLWALRDYAMVVNQLLNFLDVYVVGALSAVLFARGKRGEIGKRSWVRWAAAAVFLAACWGLVRMLRLQAESPDHASIQYHQMVYRPAFALCFAAMLLSAPFMLRPLRWLLGNRVMAFLAGISMNYYLIHQVLIVHLRRVGIPYSENAYPNQLGEQPWQTRYTLLAFGLSLAAAVLVTYGIEKPAGRLLERWRAGRTDTNGPSV